MEIYAWLIITALAGCWAGARLTWIALAILNIIGCLFILSLRPCEEMTALVCYVYAAFVGAFLVPAWITYLVATDSISLKYFIR
jgi:hypothetical protein